MTLISPGSRVSAELANTSPYPQVLKIKGTFLGTDSDGYSRIQTSMGMVCVVPSSMRRLKKKKDLRRRRWINFYPSGDERIHSSKEEAKRLASNILIECVEFVERKPK